jgi:lysophospholipase L1-like esterase
MALQVAVFRRSSSIVLLVAQMMIVLLMVRNWAYVTTYRLYLDRRIGATAHSIAAQQFDIEGERVVPRIVTGGADRVAFATAVEADSTIQVGLRPVRRTGFAINWRDGFSEHVLTRGTVDAATSIVLPFPTGSGVIELVGDEALTWVDPRVVRNPRIGPHVVALSILLLWSLAWTWRRGRRDASDRGTPIRFACFKVSAVAVGAAFALLASELALRAMGNAAPSGVLNERHDLGEVTRDARWEESPRYGRRLRANVDALNEWRDGDIVRMGYIPPAVSEATLHRFRFHTDAEGFRNPATRERFDIAALGDSFTDAMTMAVEASWPMQLERTLGVAVQNYGTAGFGPQQELLVLKDFVAIHRPRVVVLAFFAGNDIFDAEAFDDFQRSGGSRQRAAPGWRIKEVVSRADTWYVVSALRAGVAWMGKHKGPAIAMAAAESTARAHAPDVGVGSFDRGMFAVPIGGRLLRWAFMPPYLNILKYSEQELASRRGWTLTRKAIGEMQSVSRSFGAQFVVMFIPFKSQVYLPLVERTFSRDERLSAFRFYLEGNQWPVDVDLMSRNRLAQNALIRRLCDEAGIPLLDTTPALETRLATGENVYFPDESHLNENGQSVIADALAAFLRARSIP